jgi:hypothetical protein
LILSFGARSRARADEAILDAYGFVLWIGGPAHARVMLFGYVRFV